MSAEQGAHSGPISEVTNRRYKSQNDMGYDLHITRKEFWADKEGSIITLEEWQQYVATDPDLASDPEIGLRLRGWALP